MPLSAAVQHARSIMAEVDRKIEKLQSIKPFFIDLSLRENPVGLIVGQTLKDKLAILPKIRDFGFQNIHLGPLDYALPDELEVDDDFMMYLRDNGIDMHGCYAFTDIGILPKDSPFVPSSSQLKLKDYCVPNTLHEIYLSNEGMAGQYTFEALLRSLPASIAWLNENIKGDNGGKPKIFINIVDGCDAFAENLERTCELLSLLAVQPIEGISLEDDRGTYLPFQVGAFVSIARAILPPHMKILVHIHAAPVMKMRRLSRPC